MSLVRIAWAVVALACVSYVGLGFIAAKRSEAAEVTMSPTTLADIAEVVKLFPNGRMIVRDTRTIIVWNATTNTVAQCFVARATKTLSKLGQTKTGYKWEQWSIGVLAGEWTQEQCYAATIPTGY
jgi:hypothetical protein